MAATQQPQTDFVKAISRLDATALVVGSMIGSGIFIVSAEILREVQAPGLLLVVVAVAFARFTSVFWPGLSPDVFFGFTMHFPRPIGDIAVGLSPQRILAVLSVALLTWINVRGVRTAALIQTSLTAIKTGALALLILLGVTIGRNAEALAANFGGNFWATGGAAVGLGTIGAAMVGSLFSMDAWNNVGFAGSELRSCFSLRKSGISAFNCSRSRFERRLTGVPFGIGPRRRPLSWKTLGKSQSSHPERRRATRPRPR